MWKSNRKADAETRQKGAAGDGPMTVGRYLKSSREGLGQSIEDIVAMLRIHRSYIDAIEAGEVDRLPGPAYAIGFVRTYAEQLGLDGAEVVRQFKEEPENLVGKTQLVFPSPLPEGRIPSGAILLVAVILLAVVYGGWISVSSQGNILGEFVPALPERFAALFGANEKSPAPVVEGPSVSTDEQTSSSTDPKKTVAEDPAPKAVASSDITTASPVAPKVGTNEAGTGETPAKPAVTNETETDTAQANEPPGKPTDPPVKVLGAEAGGTTGDEGSAPATTTANAAVAKINGTAAATGTGETTGPAISNDPATSGGETASAGEAVRKPSQADESLSAVTAAPTRPKTVPVDPIPGETPTTVAEKTDDPSSPSPSADPDEPKIYGADNKESRIIIRAVSDSWAEVRNSDGDLLLSRVLREGDSYRVPDLAGLTLATGNAGGLEFSVDGETAPAIGPFGSVRRNVMLNPDALKDGKAHTR